MHSGLWSPEQSVHFKIVGCLSSFLYPGTVKGHSYGGMLEMAKRAITILKSLPLLGTYTYADKLVNFNFEDLQQTSIGKLLFPNGYYDGYQNQFFPCLGLSDGSKLFMHYEIFFFARCPDNYVMEWCPEAIEEMKEMKLKLFYQMHEKHIADFHIESLACALLGVKHKGFFVHIGETNSGKSTEKSMIEATFGGYIGTGSTDDFAIIKDDKRESSLVNAFAYENYTKRLIMFSEKSERKLSTELLKIHSSGQEDQIRTRVQYKAAMLVKVHYTMFFYINEAFEVTNPNDPAYIERAFFYYWNKVFVPVEKITDPTVQIPKDDTVSTWKNLSVKRQMFARIILDGFVAYVARGMKKLPIPDEIKQSTTQEVGTVETAKELTERILYSFILDGNQDVILDRDDLNEKCREMNLCPKRVGMRISSLMKELGLKTIRTQQRRINGIVQNSWVGMQVRRTTTKEGDYLTDLSQWKDLMARYRGTIPQEIKTKLAIVADLYNKSPTTYSEKEKEIIEEYATDYQREIYLTKCGSKRSRY